jgi:hypothetical protein
MNEFAVIKQDYPYWSRLATSFVNYRGDVLEGSFLIWKLSLLRSLISLYSWKGVVPLIIMHYASNVNDTSTCTSASFNLPFCFKTFHQHFKMFITHGQLSPLSHWAQLMVFYVFYTQMTCEVLYTYLYDYMQPSVAQYWNGISRTFFIKQWSAYCFS